MTVYSKMVQAYPQNSGWCEWSDGLFVLILQRSQVRILPRVHGAVNKWSKLVGFQPTIRRFESCRHYLYKV